MNRPIACCLAATFLILFPASTAAHDATPADRGNGLSACEEEYLALYKQGIHAGLDLGRNLVDDGIRGVGGPYSLPESRTCSEAEQLDAILHPPAPAPVPSPTQSEGDLYSPAPTTSTGGTPPSYIAACESGGSYTAVNPSSGAYGKWQILPSTASAYSCDLSTPEGQDACAGEIYADVGASAWVCG